MAPKSLHGSGRCRALIHRALHPHGGQESEELRGESVGISLHDEHIECLDGGGSRTHEERGTLGERLCCEGSHDALRTNDRDRHPSEVHSSAD